MLAGGSCTSGLHFNPCAETRCIVSRRDSRRAPCGSQALKEGHAARAPRLPTRGSASAPDGPGPPGALARGPRGGGVQARPSRTPTDPGSLPTGLGMRGSARVLGTRSVQSCCWGHVGLPRHFHSGKKKKKKGLAVSKAVLSEKVIFHACASEGRGVGPDGASGRRESFGTGPMASLPRFRRSRSSGPLALGSSSRRNVAYPCLVRNAQHILDNMSVFETCYFINSFLLTLCSLQMLPEQIKPLSDEKS